MTEFTVYAADDGPEAAKLSYKTAQSSFGSIPKLQPRWLGRRAAGEDGEGRSDPALISELRNGVSLRNGLWARLRID
jgi:hypothetical protein